MTSVPRLALDPETIVENAGAWVIAVNRNQNLLGKSMLVLARPCVSVTELRTDEWSELHGHMRRACVAIDSLFSPDLYNFAFLMNVDAQVHLHVVPRYQAEREWRGQTFTDPHWGSVFGAEVEILDEAGLSELAHAIRARLPAFR